MPQKRDLKTGQFIPNGGAYIDEQGYPRISCGPCRGQRIHRIVAEQKIGRKLKKNEDILHESGDKTNFHPDNLRVLGHGEHSHLEWTIRQDAHLRKQWEEYFKETGGAMLAFRSL